MTLIHVRNLGITFAEPLFSDLDLTLSAGDRLGLVAANGRGKSSFLRCLDRSFEATTGKVIQARGLTVGHVQQNVPDPMMALTLYEAVLSGLNRDQAETESWRVDILLDDLEIDERLRSRPLSQLSGGWQRLAMLARIAVAEPDVLLLDEPTNHLDLAKIGRLETWLNGLPRNMPVVVASHDRAFLDAVTNRTLFLRPENSRLFALPYSKARSALDEADAADARRFDRDIKAADQLRRQAAKLKNIGINSGSDLLVSKTKQLKERAERLEEGARPAHRDRSSGTIRLANRGTHAKVLITLEDVSIATSDGTRLFCLEKQFVCQGDRIVLLGPNGAGKTQMVKHLKAAIEGRENAIAGIKATPSLVLGYVDQALADLAPTATPRDCLHARFELSDQRGLSLLAGAGIRTDMQSKPIDRLSGGQRARLGMLMLRLTNPNFYLLDEPTNHLDIEGQEALEDELMRNEATCLLVSHDRGFVRNVGTRFWQIVRGKLIETGSPEPFFTESLQAPEGG